jgi:hypothetical protein
MTLTTVVRSEFSVDLAIEDIEGRFEVSMYQSHWGMNEIPVATCALAIGREAADGVVKAKIHDNIASFKLMKKATVYFSPYGDWDDGVPWPDGERIIFEGRVTGTGFEKAAGGVRFVVHIVHWLSDLDFGSALTTRSHPTNPAQYTFPSIVTPLVGTPGLSDTGLPVAGGIAQTAEAKSLHKPKNIKKDLWGAAIKPLFCALAREANIELSAELTRDCVGELEKSDIVLAALKRIESVGEGEKSDSPDCDLERSCYTEPLSLRLGDGGGAPESVSDSIGEALLRDTIESYNNQTMWGKLVAQFAPAFNFAVIPQVEKCLVVPFVAGLREPYCKIIEPTDYVSLSISGNLSRPLKAVVIHGSVGSDTGLGNNAGGPMQDGGLIAGICGCFSPPDIKTGMVLFENAPMWLANVASGKHSTVRSTGLSAGVGTSSATTPAEDNDELISNEEGKTQEEVYRSAATLYNGWAHTMFVSRQLAGRTGNLFGKLRFDIAPGSNIIIQGSSERFIEGDQTNERLYATVARVSFKLDASEGTAGTGFSFAHARTEEENKSDKTSLDKHPLYETKFVGAPLMDIYQFKNEDCCT